MFNIGAMKCVLYMRRYGRYILTRCLQAFNTDRGAVPSATISLTADTWREYQHQVFRETTGCNFRFDTVQSTTSCPWNCVHRNHAKRTGSVLSRDRYAGKTDVAKLLDGVRSANGHDRFGNGRRCRCDRTSKYIGTNSLGMRHVRWPPVQYTCLHNH